MGTFGEFFLGDPESANPLRQKPQVGKAMEYLEKRSEARDTVDEFYSVEFSTTDTEWVYQFKIWDISSKGICVVVKKDSDIVKHLKVGDVINMKYYRSGTSKSIEHLKTEIRHMSQDESGRFRDHCLVGLSILGNQDGP